MKGRPLIICGGLALTACGSPHRFEISSDKQIQDVEIDLANVKSAEWRMDNQNRAVAEVRSADSSGEIRIKLTGGQNVTCHIGYITGGDPEPHVLIVRGNNCREALPK